MKSLVGDKDQSIMVAGATVCLQKIISVDVVHPPVIDMRATSSLPGTDFVYDEYRLWVRRDNMARDSSFGR